MKILGTFIEAWMIGFALAAPVGPIGMLCINKTLKRGMSGALLVGLGAALADSVYGLIAALGFARLSHIMVAGTGMLKLIGGIFLLYLAYKEARAAIAHEQAQVEGKSPIKLVSEVFFLTLTNPMTILSFVGIFASISSAGAAVSGDLPSITMVIGIFFGSMTWWCLLGAIITKIRHKLPKIWLERIKWISCFILASFGLAAIVNSLMSMHLVV